MQLTPDTIVLDVVLRAQNDATYLIFSTRTEWVAIARFDRLLSAIFIQTLMNSRYLLLCSSPISFRYNVDVLCLQCNPIRHQRQNDPREHSKFQLQTPYLHT